ncbi:MAG TPA: hypothetical protein ENH59_11335 [Bacteroidetes bacterium]|nr:hypothetical protein [Bacteroidota bacterium]
MSTNQLRTITLLTLIMLVFLSVASFFGAFVDITYAREAASMAAQGMGQDIVDLFLVVPAVIISLFLMRKDKRVATLIFGGLVFYVLYSFIIYSMGVHFNLMFLVYCFTLGTASYVFISYFYALSRVDVKGWFEEGTPNQGIAIFFIIVAALFYLLWLRDVLPALVENKVPKSVSDYGLPVNPVHVIDISFALPGLIITAVLLFRKHNLAYILAPAGLVFMIVLTIALAAMVIMTRIRGISEDASLAYIFIILSVISVIFLLGFLKRIKPSGNYSDNN